MYRLHPQTAKLLELVKAVPSAISVSSAPASVSTWAHSGLITDFLPMKPRRRHSRCRRLSGFDGADDCRYGRRKTLCRTGKGGGAGASRPVGGVDEWASAVLKFANGIVAEVSCSIMAAQDNVLRIIGSEGRIEVKDFWFAAGTRVATDGSISSRVTRSKPSSCPRIAGFIPSKSMRPVRQFGRADKNFAAPGMTWADSLGNLRVMDQWRVSVGLEYSVEKATSRVANIAGAKVTAGNAVPKRQIPGLAKPASVVALGFEFFPNFASASLTLDAFYERQAISSIRPMFMVAARPRRFSATGTPAATCRAKRSC